MRSFLFVPADSERKLAKGPSSGPDGLILDLEDSVAADRKKLARDMALAYLRTANRAGPKIYVRVNALDTGLTLGDLAVVMQGKPDGIVFPKCVGQANLDLLANYLDALEAREGIGAGITRILTIATESAAAVLALTAAPGCARQPSSTARFISCSGTSSEFPCCASCAIWKPLVSRTRRMPWTVNRK